MNLPTKDQINAAARHAASFVSGAIVVFGLSKSFNPQQVADAINQLGTVASDVATLIGLISPIVAAYFAAKSASPQQQIASVAANPEVQRVVVSSQAVADAAPAKVVTPADVANGNAPPITGVGKLY